MSTPINTNRQTQPLLTTVEAAEFLSVTPQTLRTWRRPARDNRVRLPFVRLGRAVRYRMADLEAFLDDNRTTE